MRDKVLPADRRTRYIVTRTDRSMRDRVLPADRRTKHSVLHVQIRR